MAVFSNRNKRKELDGSLYPTGADSITSTNVTLDGVTSQWNGLNLETDLNTHN